MNLLKRINLYSKKNNIDKINPIFIKQIHSNNIISTNIPGIYNNYDGIIVNYKQIYAFLFVG